MTRVGRLTDQMRLSMLTALRLYPHLDLQEALP